MNSKQFRKQLRQATEYHSPTAFYTAVLLQVGTMDKWVAYSRSMEVIREALPARLQNHAHARFMIWWESQR